MGDHFNQVVEMVKLGSGTYRKVDDHTSLADI